MCLLAILFMTCNYFEFSGNKPCYCNEKQFYNNANQLWQNFQRLATIFQLVATTLFSIH